ncbi:MAG: DUF255 domain-containing protein [Acidimicrobiia bacterium]|nr:DUF255 domain-containing protein [Acidimicrobiia bacterium]
MAGQNRLASETSPYLRQHADNPVDWYPWGDEAFARARALDRPVLLSVGYSACHWCHVMAHESFEDDATAELVNERFVAVKVDREERPDVDAVYMEAVQSLTGQGGWPMTVFLTPDGRPFFGGTYFPKERRGGMPAFSDVCLAIDQHWREDRGQLDEQAGQLTDSLGRLSQLRPADHLPAREGLAAAARLVTGQHDARFGGFGRAPKFPHTMSLELLLRHHAGTGDPLALTAVETSLDAMASGGIYDHLGGGFARYSTDDRWLVPHFEKMLYDNALLVSVYTHALQVTGAPRYRQVVEETIAYVLRDLGQPAGGFSSAEDADSEGEEGRFYVWSADEVASVAPQVADWYGVTPEGNWEGTNILWRPERGALARPAAVEEGRAALFATRLGRVRPGLDDKVLTEWNALLVAALAEAGAAFGRDDWVTAAATCADFLLRELRGPDGRWLRSWQAEGGARHLAYAADHGALLGAFLSLHEATGEARWVVAARRVADDLLELFWDDEAGGVFTAGRDAEQLITRTKDLMDNATPSANSLAAVGLARLAVLVDEERYRSAAGAIVRLVGALSLQHPTAFAHLLVAVDLLTAAPVEVVVAGERPDLVRAVQRRYRPRTVLSWGEPLDGPLWLGRSPGAAYVCRAYSCLLPATEEAALLAQLDEAEAHPGA